MVSPQDFGSSNLGSIPSTVVPVFLAELHSDSSHLKNALELFGVTMKARIPLGINEKAKNIREVAQVVEQFKANMFHVCETNCKNKRMGKCVGGSSPPFSARRIFIA